MAIKTTDQNNCDKLRRVTNSAAEVRERIASVDKYSLTGVSAQGFPGKISTVRSLMLAKHCSQRLCLTNGEVARLFTGAEDAYGQKSSSFVKTDDELKLMKVFVKFPESSLSNVLYIFKNLNTGKYQCHLHTAANWNTEKFGFEIQDCINGTFTEGDIIPEGTVISKSQSFDNHNHYRAGVNALIMYTPLHDLTEDAIIISKSLAKRLGYILVDHPTVDIKEGLFLLNNYGTLNDYKAFPNIGESIKDGILCSLREKSSISSKREAMIPHINDVNYYTDGVITDIEIYSNDPDVEDKQLQYYIKRTEEWYSDIFAYISSIKQNMDEDDSVLLDIYHSAEKFIMKNAKWSTKEKLPYMQIKFTIVQPRIADHGQKITGRFGNKSVVSEVRDDELMPMLDDGRHVDMLANAFCPTNRIIAFGLSEPTLTFMMHRIHEHLVNDKVPPDEGIQLVCDFMALFNHQWADSIREKYNAFPKEAYDDILRNGLYLFLPPFQEENVRDGIVEAYSRWNDLFPRYTIKTKLRHRWIEQPEKYVIGYQYTWVLKQEASKNLSSVATGRTTLYDLPVKTSNYKHRLKKYSDNPIKFGEYDTFGFAQGVDPEDLSKISTHYRGSQYEENSILMSHLNDLEIPKDSINQFPQLECLKAYLKAMGIKLEHDFTVHSISSIDEEEVFDIGNHQIKISGSALRTVLIIYSYYLNYSEYVRYNSEQPGLEVDMVDFTDKILHSSDVFYNKPQWYIDYVFPKFFELYHILEEEKYLK